MHTHSDPALKVLYNLIYRLHRIAGEEGHAPPDIDTEQWVTYPLVVSS